VPVIPAPRWDKRAAQREGYLGVAVNMKSTLKSEPVYVPLALCERSGSAKSGSIKGTLRVKTEPSLWLE
jgi:hypothetical protein